MKRNLIENLLITHSLANVIMKSYHDTVTITHIHRTDKKYQQLLKAYEQNPEKNAKPSIRSLHFEAKAVDMTSLDVLKLYNHVIKLIDAGIIPEGGVGLYKTHVHYDWRGFNARWNKV
jgi:uncharacterized protein YcbK (DUF882 family)